MKKTNAEHPKFSVIVPAHNSALYIWKGLDSIRDQTFKDFELIVVCDACTDDTVHVAREYTDKVYEVNYHQDGQTRNFGLDHATGEWVLFLDDDDWFLHEYVFDMLNQGVGQNNEDILAFSFIWKGVGYAQNRAERMYIAVWNKCWRRAFIGDTRFSDVQYTSDLDFHTRMMQKQPRVVFWNQPFYYYNFMRKGSLSREMHDPSAPSSWSHQPCCRTCR